MGAKFERIAVYCGASPGNSEVYRQAAEQLGQEMCRRGIKLVYGGGDIGLMGQISRTVAKGLGEESVMSVIPEALVAREISGKLTGDAHVVKDIHERKKMMSDAAQAFIALPGGYGSLEELIEMVTWQQLGYHTKPVGILNVNGFYDHLISFVNHMVNEGFVRESNRSILIVGTEPAELIDKLEQYKSGDSLLDALADEAKQRSANGMCS